MRTHPFARCETRPSSSESAELVLTQKPQLASRPNADPARSQRQPPLRATPPSQSSRCMRPQELTPPERHTHTHICEDLGQPNPNPARHRVAVDLHLPEGVMPLDGKQQLVGACLRDVIPEAWGEVGQPSRVDASTREADAQARTCRNIRRHQPTLTRKHINFMTHNRIGSPGPQMGPRREAPQVLAQKVTKRKPHCSRKDHTRHGRMRNRSWHNKPLAFIPTYCPNTAVPPSAGCLRYS